MELDGSEDTKSLKVGFDPSMAKASNFFSRSIKKLGMR